MASFVLQRDRAILADTVTDISQVNYRVSMAQLDTVHFLLKEKLDPVKGIEGIYPLPSRRVAAYDEILIFSFSRRFTFGR